MLVRGTPLSPDSTLPRAAMPGMLLIPTVHHENRAKRELESETETGREDGTIAVSCAQRMAPIMRSRARMTANIPRRRAWTCSGSPDRLVLGSRQRHVSMAVVASSDSAGRLRLDASSSCCGRKSRCILLTRRETSRRSSACSDSPLSLPCACGCGVHACS